MLLYSAIQYCRKEDTIICFTLIHTPLPGKLNFSFLLFTEDIGTVYLILSERSFIRHV